MASELQKMQGRSKGMSEIQIEKAALKKKPAAKMVDMKEPKRKGSNTVDVAYGKAPRGPSYPYGTEMSLEHESLKKLGLKAPKAGDKVTIHAKGHFTNVSSHDDGKGARHSGRVQVTHMKMASDHDGDE